MLKPTIISISMATVLAGAAISPALAQIASAFPEASPVMIKTLLTAPSITIIPFSFISSYLTTKMPKRSIVLIGLLIYLIGGAGAQFVHSIELLLAFRLLLGIGVGLIIPLSMSLINDHFTGKERTKMMGYNSAFSNLGGIVTMIVAGFLATYGWRLPFNVYLIGLIIMGLVYFFLPRDQVYEKNKDEPKKKLPLIIYGYALGASGIMLVYYSIATNMALFLEQNELGGPALSGTVISFTTIGGMITSLALVWLQSTLKEFIMPVMLFGMVLAFSFLAFTNFIPLIMVAVCLIGFGQGALFPTIILNTLDHVSIEQADRAVSILVSLTFCGQFLSPVILDGIGKLLNNPSIRFQYTIIAVILMVTVLLNVRTVLKDMRNKEQETAAER